MTIDAILSTYQPQDFTTGYDGGACEDSVTRESWMDEYPTSLELSITAEDFTNGKRDPWKSPAVLAMKRLYTNHRIVEGPEHIVVNGIYIYRIPRNIQRELHRFWSGEHVSPPEPCVGLLIRTRP